MKNPVAAQHTYLHAETFPRISRLKNHRRDSFYYYSTADSNGLTIVEILVSLVIIAAAIAGAGTLLNVGVVGVQRSGSNYSTQNLIDKNLSEIESAADRYTCASTCSVVSGIPSKSGYVNPSNSAIWDAFVARCDEQDFSAGEDLMSPLVGYIDDNIEVPSGLYREIQINGSGSTSDVGFGRIKHFIVQYRSENSSGPILRNSTIVPTIISYCP